MTDIPFTPSLLRFTYSQGFFPMPDDDGIIYWYSPDPRAVFPLDEFHCSRSFRKTLRNTQFAVTFDKDFLGVMRACADREDTWINEEFIDVYGRLHKDGDAHSVEVWLDEKLVGGLYGVSIAGGFFAESMFYKETDASKFALYHLIKHMKKQGMTLLEVQFMTPHLKSLGAIELAADDYLDTLAEAIKLEVKF